MRKMNYQEAMDYLVNLTKFGWNPGLSRIEKLLQLLGNPERDYKVIHVGGTNGKGSTSKMIASILQQAGLKVGFFSSPHLHSYTERMQINGRLIPEERVAELLTTLRPHLDTMVEQGFEHPTEFEVSTALAFLYFSQEKVDFAVMEVGLGGAIDSTNVVQPLVAVITNVGMDHMDYLGETIEEIATVKAGIIKPGCRVVTATDRPEALKVIKDTCREKGVELTIVGQDVCYTVDKLEAQGTSFSVKGLKGNYQELFTPLTGSHQAKNGATAVAAIEALNAFGYNITPEEIKKGLASVSWPGRLEVIGKNPLVLIDAAHNVDGAKTLSEALKNVFQYGKLIFVLGMLADKEREKVLALLGPLADKIVVTKPNNPRAGEWREVADIAKEYTDQVYLIEDIEEAVEKGLSLAGDQDLLCITGSFYMVAEARAYLLASTLAKN